MRNSKYLLIVSILILAGTLVDSSLCSIPVKYDRTINADEIRIKVLNNESVGYDHCIIGGDLNLSGLDINVPIRINDSKFDGLVSFDDTNFKDQINLSNSNFKKDAYFYNASFCGYANFYDTSFSKYVNFYDSSFGGYANFYNSSFGRYAYFTSTSFDGRSNFIKASFSGESNFIDVSFGGHADFSGATFDEDANLYGATFDENADFIKASFGERADFSDISFGGYADFTSDSFDAEADFSNTSFGGYADFTSDSFGEYVDFTSASFEGDAYFVNSNFTHDVSFKNSNFKDNALFQGAQFHETLDLDRADYTKLYIRWQNITKLSFDETTYLLLIENFKRLGFYSDADDCYRSYREQNRCNLPWYIRPIDWLLWLIYGYGTKPEWAFLMSLLIIPIFGIIFYFTPDIETSNKKTTLEEAMYLSASAFTSGARTFGGFVSTPDDIVVRGKTRYILGAEKLLGLILIGAFLTALAKTVIR